MAVLPLVRARRVLKLDATALVIGSMAPDFEYFARGYLHGSFAHTLVGWWVFGVPLSLALAALWQLRVGPMLAFVAPAAIRRRGLVVDTAGWWRGGVAGVIGGVLGAAIGVATHFVWDSATHWSGFIVHHAPSLTTPVAVPVLGSLPLHRVIQHISSIVGLAAVVVAAVVAIRARPVREPEGVASAIATAVARRAARVAVLLCFVGGEAVALARLAIFHRSEATAPDSLVVAVISGALLAAIAASFVVRPSR